VLSDGERDQLAVWSRGSSRLAVRARIVLACAEPGVSDERVAADVGVSRMTVHAWRRRFAEDRLAGLGDRARPGRPKADLVLSDAERQQLTRWSRRAKSSQALALRARIILACAEPGAANKAVAADLRVM
jgi:transposase-like protein